MSPTTGPYAGTLGPTPWENIRAALAAAATSAPQPADVVRDLDPVQLVALHEAVRDALVVKGIGRTDPSAICSATPAPPVDVAARFLAASKAAESADASLFTVVDLLQLGRDRLPRESPQVVEAIARALTGEARS